MNAQLYFNKSDRRYLNKEIDTIGDPLNLEFIEPVDIINPTFILSNESRVREANYIFVPDLSRYYYIERYVFEYDRIIIDCKVDVLMSFKGTEETKGILDLEIITARTSNTSKQNFYIPDEEIKFYSYPFIEVHKLKCTTNNGFNQDTCNYILATAGAVSGGNNNEE